MGTLTGTNIASRVRDILQDPSGVRWGDSELLRYINDGQREIVNLRPDSSSTHSNVQLATGTEQSIPSTGVRLIKVVRNMASTASDAAGGRAIRVVDEDILNSQDPNWHTASASGSSQHGTTVKHYIFDSRDPKKFYVYPGVSGNAFVEIVFSSLPTDLSALSDTIYLDDIFGTALIDYTLYRSYQKDAEYAANFQRSQFHGANFTASLGMGSQVKTLTEPAAGVKGQT